jgi:hypothetical protein
MNRLISSAKSKQSILPSFFKSISTQNALVTELHDKINLKLKFSRTISEEERKFFQFKSGFTINNTEFLSKEGKFSLKKNYLDYNIHVIYYLNKIEVTRKEHPIINLFISINKIGKKNGIICKGTLDDVSNEVLLERISHFDDLDKEMKLVNLVGSKKESNKYENFEKFGDLLKNGFDDFLVDIGLNKENLKFIKKSAFYEGKRREIDWLILFKNVVS